MTAPSGRARLARVRPAPAARPRTRCAGGCSPHGGLSPPHSGNDRRDPLGPDAQRPPDLLVEGLVLRGRHLRVPVPAARKDLAAGPAGPALPGDEQVVEDVRGRDVEEDVGEVLATDQVHVVDAQIDRRHLVARGPPRALPLDDVREATAQPVSGGEKGPPVLPGSVEFGVVGRTGAELGQLVPHLGGDAAHDRCPRPDRLVDVGASQGAERGAQLGHHGARARHGRILPCTAARGSVATAPPARDQSLNRGVSCSSSGPTAASAATCSSVLS